MERAEVKTLLEKAYRQYARVLAFALLGMFVGSMCMALFLSLPQSLLGREQNNETKNIDLRPSFMRSAPTELRIPKIGLVSTFETPLGLNDDLTVEVPESYEKVGWYKNGATPGEIGSAVILGHVDSFKGPAIFFDLKKLGKGDEIAVLREDGSTATFVVEEVGKYSQDEFPTEKVYGKTDIPTLRLVTCTGVFDRGAQRYSHNLVVYASLKK